MEKPSSTQSGVSSNTLSASSTKRFKSAYSQAALHSFMNEKTRLEITAKLDDVDGFPPSAVCNIEFICHAISGKGKLLQKNPNHVTQLAYKQYEVAQGVAMMDV